MPVDVVEDVEMFEEVTVSETITVDDVTDSTVVDNSLLKEVLVVDDDSTENHTNVVVSKSTMSKLGLFAGDTVMLKGKRSKSTVATVQPDETSPESMIKMNKVTRSNLR